ncbi:MAG: mannitol dehydrogenase family protein [Rhodobacterales bacterium]|nr:mannitol dehydrogenase family protein [Rhodobacterales bacterium]NCT12852.1 mannitol dehydrogenase family protein [Rhodobacterales bacterium]
MAIPLNTAALAVLPAGVAGPSYDRSALRAGILHLGVGNFHRAHMAVYLDRLFALGRDQDWAILGAGVRPGDAVMRARLAAQDWLSTVVELDPAGLSARVVGAMVGFVPVEAGAVIAAMSDPAIRIVSLTVTEGGYFIDASTDGFDAAHPDIAHDAAHPDAPRTVFGMMLAALRDRQTAGVAPFTVMSCDNLPENGHVAARALVGLAGLSDPALAGWIAQNVAFPNGMVDCITPATSDRERALVADRFGLTDAAPVACEPFRQWVLEDRFPTGRPALEEVGVAFVQNVADYELMKLRILNGGHAAIAYAGALLGHDLVHDAMADGRIARWLDRLTRDEIIPTLRPIPGVSFDAYRARTAERFANPQVGDTIPRLCLDGSNRQPKFILPTLRQALAEGRAFRGLALEVALWCRYCEGTTEAGAPIAPNDDNAADLRARALAARDDAGAFLSHTRVFGDLGMNARFAAAFAAQLAAIRDRGVAAALAAYAA